MSDEVVIIRGSADQPLPFLGACASVPEIRPLHPLHEAACIGFALVQGYDPIEAVCALLLGGQAACGT